jgi:HTH-type transcriptional regulator / antitoxin HipB
MSTPIRTVADLGEIVRTRRKKLGYNQARTADFCGTGVRFISDLENGKNTIELGKVLTVVASLGIDLEAKTRGETT